MIASQGKPAKSCLQYETLKHFLATKQNDLFVELSKFLMKKDYAYYAIKSLHIKTLNFLLKKRYKERVSYSFN